MSVYFPSTPLDRLRYNPLTPQKCDAKRPCTRCVNANNALGCEYQIVGTPPGASEDPRFLIWDKPDRSGSSDVFAQERGVVVEAVPEVSSKKSPVTITPAPKPIPPASAHIHSYGRNSPRPHTSPTPQPHVLNASEAHDPPYVILPPVSVLLSLAHSRIPLEPHVTSPFLGAERSQLSDAALGELDMKLYASRVR